MSQRSLEDRLKAAARRRVILAIRGAVPDLAPDLMQFALFWPHDYHACVKPSSYSRPVDSSQPTTHPLSALPVPPREFWANYGTSIESYLQGGRNDVETMRRLLAESGAPIENASRVLELGCAGGRMIRWLADLAPRTQLWGTDIWASAILWCQDYLSPPCYFATNTIIPHLSFEDRSFDLVYCGSLFTHIDDLAESWFLELHRILRPGGRLYFSINDRNSISIFDGKNKPDDTYMRLWEQRSGDKEEKDELDRFVAAYSQLPGYRRLRDGDAYMVTMGRSIGAHVMWDTEVLCRRLGYGYRRCSITPEGYGYQTVVLLERV
jgi:SAM-dependent methyltransferase